MSRKIIIPKDSIVILPKKNLNFAGFKVLRDLEVEEKEVTVYKNFKDYCNKEKKQWMKKLIG